MPSFKTGDSVRLTEAGVWAVKRYGRSQLSSLPPLHTLVARVTGVHFDSATVEMPNGQAWAFFHSEIEVIPDDSPGGDGGSR